MHTYSKSYFVNKKEKERKVRDVTAYEIRLYMPGFGLGSKESIGMS